MKETIFEQETANLLEHISRVVKDFDSRNRESGAKYNIFTITNIETDEKKLCLVIADLLNPKGRHGKGAVYLELFKQTVLSKDGFEAYRDLRPQDAVASTEYFIRENARRIDIIIADKTLFIPIEVKVFAGEQENQVADYYESAQAKNRGHAVPVLYLTLSGDAPSGYSAGKAEEYRCISFRDDILSWLEECLSQKETERTAPVYEIIKQFIKAVKSICGYSEDEAMNKEIAELITHSDETIRAAVAISSVLKDFDEESWKLFKGAILNAVKNELSQEEKAKEYDDVEDGHPWHAIAVPLLNGQYTLYVPYNWKTIQIYRESDKADPDTEKKLAAKMSEITRYDNESWEEKLVWATKRSRYPGMEDIDDAHYDYKRYRLYSKNPDAVARQIVSIVQALEKV